MNIIASVLLGILLIAFQVWVFNDWNFFQLATPFPYIYILCLFPLRASKIATTVVAFICGAVIDIFSGTAGLHTAVFTALGFSRNYLLQLFSDEDSNINLPPSVRAIGKSYFLFLLMMITFHQILLFALDSMGAYNFSYFLMRTFSSIGLTYIIVIIVDMLFASHYSTKIE